MIYSVKNRKEKFLGGLGREKETKSWSLKNGDDGPMVVIIISNPDFVDLIKPERICYNLARAIYMQQIQNGAEKIFESETKCCTRKYEK
jgi:hypothetical protein